MGTIVGGQKSGGPKDPEVSVVLMAPPSGVVQGLAKINDATSAML
jgi:hypothetical protein